MSDPVARLNAALEGRYVIERGLGEGGMVMVYLPPAWSRGGGVFLVTATLLFASGCATKGDVRRLQDEMTAQAALHETQLQELAAENQALRELLEAQSAIQSEIGLDTQGGNARVHRDMQDSLSVLTQLVGQILRSQVVLSERIEADGARVTTSPGRADPDSLGALIRRDGDPARCDENYEAARTRVNRGLLDTARFAFSRFIADCPDHPQLASAQFSLGDIHFQQDRYDEAIEAFLLVRELYPLADSVPVALYRIGLIYLLQENVETARTYLELVVTSYADSGAADLARAELEEIR